MRARANEIRIIGGRWRGRRLRVPATQGVRPTPDRVRETLFNWLGQDLSGRVCLDLFAGSGALGFEALSRGAGRVVAVERNREVAARLQAMAQALGAEGYELHCTEASAHLGREDRRFDVIFVDPPYSEPWLERLHTHLLDRLTDDGLVYVESAVRVDAPAGLELLRFDRAGQVHYHLLRRSKSPRGG